MNELYKSYSVDFSHIKNSVDMLDELIASSVGCNASDLHIDPKEDFILVRIRIDGVMYFLSKLNILLHESLISRLKILSATRVDVHDFPQDGRFTIKINNIDYSVRVSFMPTFFGENAVLRILSTKKKDQPTLNTLGFSPDHIVSIQKVMNKSHGMILVTGPTGSGKSTTLYTCLSQKTKDNISVISLEDPIEYEIDNVRQIHVKQNQGVTFSNVLRSVLRQDPDVIMVGEIRDVETANLSLHTALTGHLLFSTIHTNNAIDTITRLIGMGIEPYVISSTLKLIISQRLVRNICKSCTGCGCDFCGMTGYRSRSIISELLEVDDQIKNIINNFSGTDALTNYLSQTGWKDIEADAMEKVEWGITTKDEVLRVLNV